MRAVNPLDAADASAEKRSYEPSMEEILASIRRIIADDQSLPHRAAAVSAAPAPDAEVAGASRAQVLQDGVAETMSINSESPREAFASEIPAVGRPLGEASRRLGLADARSVDGDVARFNADAGNDWDPPAAPVREQEQLRPVVPPSPGALLREPPVAERAPEPADKASIFSAETDAAVGAAFNMLAASRLANSSDEIMALAREMIRPLLRSWIDDNLPSMVERLVRAEIERVARGGRAIG